MTENGYIKLHRKFLEWEWCSKSEMVNIFIHFLLSANYEPSRFQGHDIPRGSLVTGLFALSEQTGVSVRSIRTCLDRLKQTGEILIKSTNKFSIITLCNYDKYQSREYENDKQPTNNRQTTDNQSTTSEELKKLRKKEIKNNTCPFFEKFYSEYPRKIAKADAVKAWSKISDPEKTVELILSALKWQKELDQWKKNDGQFIPHPATYLNHNRWQDERQEKQIDAFDNF
jgi:hypothetical protein